MVGTAIGIALIAGPAVGQLRNVPKKANKYQATIVQGVEACTVANTIAPGALMTPACDPVVPSDPNCLFDAKGGGKVLAKAKDDIKIVAKLKKLVNEGANSCEGETLCAVASIRTTADACGTGNPCTTIDQDDLPLGLACCQVQKGKCKIKTTVNTALPGALVPGNRTEFTIGQVGLKRTGSSGVAFRAGLFLE
jgi:hypothetical protein